MLPFSVIFCPQEVPKGAKRNVEAKNTLELVIVSKNVMYQVFL